MATFSAITPSTVHVPPSFSYSQAVRMGDLIFVAGQVAENAKGELVGKVTVLTTSLAHRLAIHEVRSEVFGPSGHYPASTLAVITSLAKPGFLVEIDAIALARAAAG